MTTIHFQSSLSFFLIELEIDREYLEWTAGRCNLQNKKHKIIFFKFIYAAQVGQSSYMIAKKGIPQIHQKWSSWNAE